MRTTTGLLLLVLSLILTGCDLLNRTQVDNPVMGPPPPRQKAPAGDSVNQQTAASPEKNTSPEENNAGGTVVQAGLTGGSVTAGEALPGSQVVATVNGTPIFASEILERYAPQLKKARQTLPPARLRKLRRKLIRRDLPDYIDRTLLIESLQEKLQDKQIEKIKQQLRQAFSQHIDRLKKQFDVGTKHEVEQKLRQQGTSLSKLQTAFVNQQMAREYLRTRSQRHKSKVGRVDLINYYREHLEKYTKPARVRWQQIHIAHRVHGGKKAARRVLRKAIRALKEGDDFAAVARRYSDGPTAQDGGHWGWTQKGSLANKEVEKALFELPVGSISQVFEGQQAFRIVKALERDPGGRIPFAEVQSEIHKILKKRQKKKSTKEILEELRNKATIHTIFENSPAKKKTPPRLPFE